jgi:hypothetical protein
LPSINEIIIVNASIRKNSVDLSENEAKIAYNIKYNVIYRDSAHIDSKEDQFERTFNMKIPELALNKLIDFDISILNIEYTGTINLKIRAEIEIKGFKVIESEIILPDIDSDILVKTMTSSVEEIVQIKDNNFKVTGEFVIKEGLSKILLDDSRIIINKVQYRTEICTVEGECLINVIYLSDGNICTRHFPIKFNEECLIPLDAPIEISCMGEVVDCEIIVDCESIEKESTTIKISLTGKIKGFGIISKDVNFPVDAYSLIQELNLKFDDYEIQKNNCINVKNEKIKGVIHLNDDDVRIRSILATTAPYISIIEISNTDGLSIDGIVTLNVIYLNKNDEISTELAEIPYHITLDKELDKFINPIIGRMLITDTNVRGKHNDEIEINLELDIVILGVKTDHIKYIKSIKENGVIINNESAISIYVTKKDETLWDVAKALKTDPEKLLIQNPELKTTVRDGEKVILYRGLKTNL